MGASGTYHVKLLLDSPLVEGQVLIGPHGDRLVIARMTDAGHEFTELIRPPEVWEEVQPAIEVAGLLSSQTRRAFGNSDPQETGCVISRPEAPSRGGSAVYEAVFPTMLAQ